MDGVNHQLFMDNPHVNTIKKKVLVCGSRSWWKKEIIAIQFAKWLWQQPAYIHVQLIHGGADGADTIAAELAKEIGWEVLPPFEPDWKRFGRAAGIVRNQTMLDEKPDYIFIFWDNQSPGTKFMIKEVGERDIPATLIVDDSPPPPKPKPQPVQTSLI